MPQVFLSYDHDDDLFADFARDSLEKRGVSVWIDNKIEGGDEWRNEIDEAIRGSDVLIVVLSPSSFESTYVTYEWGFALGIGRKVIPILHRKTDIHPRLDILQRHDFRSHRDGPWDKLVQEIENAKRDKSDNRKSRKLADLTEDEFKELMGSIKDAPDSTSSTNNRKILWVDDRPANNIQEQRVLQSLGYEFAIAKSTDEALDILDQESFCAIISDMGRVEGPQEGYVLLEKVRKNDKKTPFFIYAGSNRPEHKIEAMDRGAQGSTNNAKELINLIVEHVE